MDAALQAERLIAIDAVDTLNDLVGDLMAGTLVLADYQQDFRSQLIDEEQLNVVQKMCVSHIVLAFAKLLEFWRRYHQLVPAKHRDDLKSLNSQLKSRGAENFRNTVAGHIWDRKHQRPLRQSEIMQMLEVLTGGKLGEFLRWVNDPNGNTYPETVLSVIEAVRDSIVAKHQIRVEEVISR